MTLHGVDVFIWSAETPDLFKEHGPMKLELISNRGTKIYPGPAPDIKLLDWPRCRFTSDDVVSNQQIEALLNDLTAAGFTWTKCQKLFRDNGTNLYSQPY